MPYTERNGLTGTGCYVLNKLAGSNGDVLARVKIEANVEPLRVRENITTEEQSRLEDLYQDARDYVAANFPAQTPAGVPDWKWTQGNPHPGPWWFPWLFVDGFETWPPPGYVDNTAPATYGYLAIETASIPDFEDWLADQYAALTGYLDYRYQVVADVPDGDPNPYQIVLLQLQHDHAGAWSTSTPKQDQAVTVALPKVGTFTTTAPTGRPGLVIPAPWPGNGESVPPFDPAALGAIRYMPNGVIGEDGRLYVIMFRPRFVIAGFTGSTEPTLEFDDRYFTQLWEDDPLFPSTADTDNERPIHADPRARSFSTPDMTGIPDPQLVTDIPGYPVYNEITNYDLNMQRTWETWIYCFNPEDLELLWFKDISLLYLSNFGNSSVTPDAPLPHWGQVWAWSQVGRMLLVLRNVHTIEEGDTWDGQPTRLALDVYDLSTPEKDLRHRIRIEPGYKAATPVLQAGSRNVDAAVNTWLEWAVVSTLDSSTDPWTGYLHTVKVHRNAAVDPNVSVRIIERGTDEDDLPVGPIGPQLAGAAQSGGRFYWQDRARFMRTDT